MRAAGVQPPMSPQAEGAPTGATGYGAPGGITQDETRELAEWLSTVNLRQGKWSYELKTFPRVTGRGTRVIITEYALPRKETMVHDADYNPADGTVWYTDFGHQFVGNLDPRTGKVTEYPVPITDPTYPHGFNDTRTDIEGNVWFGNMSQVQLVKFDKKTRQIQTFRPPPELAIGSSIVMVMPYNTHVDGKIWTNNVGRAGVFRYDVNTGKWDIAYPYDYWLQDFDRHGVYGINSDAENNLYINAVGRNMVIKVDAKTLKARFYETPTSMSGPRRGRFDALYRLWVALTLVDKVAIFDPKTERFTEYAAPTPFSQAYDAMADEFGNVWWGGETSDRVYRLDPRTGEHTQYQLPKTHTDIRRVDVDSSTGMPVFWVGDCHSPAIFKVEPLD
jgi:streptogramin lyase